MELAHTPTVSRASGLLAGTSSNATCAALLGVGLLVWSSSAAAESPRTDQSGESSSFANPSYAPSQPAPPGGELLPPPPPATPESINTMQQLERAEREDSGRGLQFFWIDPEVGVKWVDLSLLSNSELVDGDDFDASGFGPSLGAGIGGRFLYFTAGARFRYTLLPLFDLWTLGLEGSLRIPLGRLEPYLFVGGGYLRTTGVDAKDGGRFKDLVLSGGYAAFGGGVDYFITPVLALGARADVEVTLASREALATETSGIYAEEGSGIGLAGTAALHVSLHF